MFGFGQNKKITEKLYEQNLELAVKNKTLSLLEKLYQTSVLTLMPQEMAEKITGIIRQDLNLELAGVLTFEKATDTLAPLAFSKSERLAKTLDTLGFLFSGIPITNVSKREFFKKVVFDRAGNTTNNLAEVWQELIKAEHVKEIKKASHIKTVLLYPLIKGNEVFAVLMLGFNRDYNTLNSFEKASITSFINVIALLLDKAYLYKNLQDSYEVTKRAYAVEKKANEELANLDKTKNQFLLTVQHHLRTPLTSMMGYSDLLVNGAFGKQNKKTLEVIGKFQLSTQSLIKMVNDFLDITQFQLGKSVVTLKPGVELNPMLDEIVNDIKFGAEKRGIYLKLEKPEQMVTISADREKLKAALQNIFDNAIKYTLKGGVTIHVAADSVVHITVTDTGIGLTQEKLKDLFNKPFERGDKARQAFAVGSGVGLYLSSVIIKSHNGKIWAESEGEGKGSVFHIEFPKSN